VAIDYAALKTELQTDPDSVGYAAPLAAGQMNALADLLNAIPSSGASAPYTVNDPLVDSGDARGVIPDSELTGATAAEQQVLEFYFGGEQVSNTSEVRTFVQGVSSFSAGTKSALNALTQREGSRAEELYGAGTTISKGDIHKALAS
jgi:hypothetical protein